MRLTMILWLAAFTTNSLLAAAPQAATDPPPAPKATEPSVADRQFAAILKDVVTPDGLVRYERLSRDRSKISAVCAEYAKQPLPATEPQRIALWTNAYNANVLDGVSRAIAAGGFTRVIDIDGFFDEQKITVAGEAVTLNDLENKRLRPVADARIHAALVCAAISCPPLRAEPFLAERLDEQLDDQARRWVNDPAKFRVRGSRLGLSKIIEWYNGDFTKAPWPSPAAFVRAFAEPAGPLARLIDDDADGRPDTEYLEYDWTLNRAK